MREHKTIGIDEIVPSKFRLREVIDTSKLEEMAKTFKSIGMLQEITVRPLKNGKYEIISGERRWRSAKLAGMKEIEVLVKDVDDNIAKIEALIENAHREDLSPIEKAKGLREIYKIGTIVMLNEVIGALSALHNLKYKGSKYRSEEKLSEFEIKIKDIADMIGISYGQQGALLEQLRLPEKELDAIKDKNLDMEKVVSITKVEDEKLRKQLTIEAPDMKREVVRKVAMVLKTPEVKSLPKDDQMKIVERAKTLTPEQLDSIPEVIKEAPKSERPREIIESVISPQSRVSPRVVSKILEELPKNQHLSVIRTFETNAVMGKEFSMSPEQLEKEQLLQVKVIEEDDGVFKNAPPDVSLEFGKFLDGEKCISRHDEIKQMIKEIGDFLGFASKCEDEGYDCAWRKKKGIAPFVVFEVQDKGSLDKALRKLDKVSKYGGKTYLISTPEWRNKALKETKDDEHVKIIKDFDIETLYRYIKKANEVKIKIGIEWN